jgi:cytochrome P450
MVFHGRAAKDMILPFSKPIVGLNGKEVTEVMVPNGTDIIISVLGSNTNPDLWGDDANKWKPERWLSPLPKTVAEAHMPGIYSHL